MRTIDIHEAKANLFHLIEQAARGQSFLIAVSSRPRVMVIPVESPAAGDLKPLGFFDGVVCVPHEVDQVDRCDDGRSLDGTGRWR
jgi:prevent-host-death family protein